MRQQVALSTTIEDDQIFAHRCTEKVERESKRRKLQEDTVEMWRDEVERYDERRRKRREREAEKRESEKAEEETRAQKGVDKCSPS